jgi:hypothetical protein
MAADCVLTAFIPCVEIVEAVKALILPLIVLKLKVPIMFAVTVPELTKSDLKVSAVIRPVLIKLVLRKPVLIGSKDEFMMPPFAMLIPPFTLMVDALRVEGMPPPPPGVYGDPLIVFTIRVLVLMLNELMAPARTRFVLKILVFVVFVAIVPAWTVFVLMVVVLMDPALIAFPM